MTHPALKTFVMVSLQVHIYVGARGMCPFCVLRRSKRMMVRTSERLFLGAQLPVKILSCQKGLGRLTARLSQWRTLFHLCSLCKLRDMLHACKRTVPSTQKVKACSFEAVSRPLVLMQLYGGTKLWLQS